MSPYRTISLTEERALFPYIPSGSIQRADRLLATMSICGQYQILGPREIQGSISSLLSLHPRTGSALVHRSGVRRAQIEIFEDRTLAKIICTDST